MPDNLDNLLAQLAIPGSQGGGGGGTPLSPYAPPTLNHPGGRDNLDNLLASFPAGPTGPQQPIPPQAPSAPQKPAQAPESALGSAITGAADTGSFGLLDEASGLLETLGVTAGTDAKSVWSSGKSFSDTLAENIAYERGLQKADAEAHPYAFHGGQLGGAFLVPFGSGAKGALQVARAGALQGAAYGAGSTDGGLADRAGGAAMGGIVGAAGATLLHPILAGASALGRKLMGKVAPAVEDAAAKFTPEEEAGGLTGTVTDTSPPVPQEPPSTSAWSQPDAQGNRQPITAVEHRALTPGDDHPIPLFANDNRTPAEHATAMAHSAEAAQDLATQRAAQDAPLVWDGAADGGRGAWVEAASAPGNDNVAGSEIGSISRAGLQDLQSQVEKLRTAVGETDGRAVDITPTSPEHPALGAFRLGNLGDGPEPMSLLGALTRQLDGLPKLSDAELAKQVQAAAKDLAGGDHEAVSALASQIAGPGGRPDLAIGVLRTVQRRAAESMDLFHGAGIDWTTASDDMVKEAGQSIYNLQKINELVQSAKVGAGRALRVFSLPNSEDYFNALAKGESLGSPLAELPGQAGRTVPPLPSTRQELADHFELWGMVKGNPELESDFLQGTLTVPAAGHYLQSSFANLFTANILSAGKTVVMNLTGPMLINGVRSLEKMAGGAVLALDPTISAAERAQYAATTADTPKALYQTLGDIRDVFKFGVQAFKENHTVLGGGGTVRDANISFGPYNENLLRAAGADPDWRYTLGNVINIWPKAFARVNAGLDEMAKRFSYLNEARLAAHVEAAGKGLEGDEAQQFVRDALASSMDSAGHATDEGLLAAAERTTLTGHVGSDNNLAQKFYRGVQALRKDYPLTRFILPVLSVPANALGETLKRVPGINLLPMMGTHVADLAGENGAVAQAEAHGRTLLGSSFLMAGYLMNQAGLLTGAGPQNPADARVWRQTHEPYSIRVGDTWVSYRKMDILGGLLSIPATLADASVYHKMDSGDDLGSATMAAVGSLATWFKDQASMRTATQLLTLGDTPMQDPGKTVEAMFGQIAGGMASPAFVRTLGVDAQDPYQRMKRGWEDYVKASFPGMSQELEPLRNVLGEPINRPNNSLGEAVFPVTLAPVATYTKEPVLDELTRLYQKTGYSGNADPHAALFGFKDPRDVKLEDGVSLYSHLTQPRATMQLDGMTLKEALKELIDSPEYNEAVDADAGQSVTSQGQQSRAYMVGQVFDRYNKAIKAEVAAAYPTALKYMTAAAAQHRGDAYLKSIPIETLVNNPALLYAAGIDPEAYSDQITGGSTGELLRALQGGGQ